MRWGRWIIGVGLLLVLAFVLRLAWTTRELRSTPTASAEQLQALEAAAFGPAVHVGSLAHPKLREASGLAASLRRPDLLWAVNDGARPQALYALGLDGSDRGAFAVEPVLPSRGYGEDWEDLDRLQAEGRAYLVVADVGDNRARRELVRLYGFEEPEVGSEAPAARPISASWQIGLRYPDGPRDCEAMAVDPERGVVMLISKRTRPPVLYEAPIRELVAAGGGEVVVHPVAALSGLPFPSPADAARTRAPGLLHAPTGLALAPDGRSAVVLSYAAAWHYGRAPEQSWAEALAGVPRRVGLPPLPLAEAVTFVGPSLYVSSELEPLALFQWPAALYRLDPLSPATALRSGPGALRGSGSD